MDTIFYRIRSVSDKWYDDFYSVYSVSFPPFEQRNRKQQEYAFSFDSYHLDCLVEGGRFLAFIAYWDFDEYIYIEHLAVAPACRNENTGSRALRKMIDEKQKMILLEIDPFTTDIARKRFRFYERLGFVMNNYAHRHPPYDKNFPPHELILLSSGRPVNEVLFQTFRKDLSGIVMDGESE
ncbi:MAG: GNAT family N-acetyltransferase [Tannerellaceae bacterium]|jgi:ribosomal protein S18 acetylase RimI-like enzyme|nr:GNAT family N-acetyltransferase [Tannerellaceae bacterium]